MPIKVGSPPPPPPKTSSSTASGSSPSPPQPPLKSGSKPPPPPSSPDILTDAEKAVNIRDVPWDNRNVRAEDYAKLMIYDPQYFCDVQALEANRRQMPLWEVGRRHDPSIKNAPTVEEHLQKLRSENQRVQAEIVDTALKLKEHYWRSDSSRNFQVLQDHVRGEVTQKYHIPKGVRLSYRKKGQELPAEAHRDEVWSKINKALDNLDKYRTDGIVLLTGGTGTGKSSISPPGIYLDTITMGHAERRFDNYQKYGLGELRPGGKLLVTQPRKALARTMATYLRELNPQHEHLFGFQHAGSSTSAQHDEPVLYLTDGIAVSILLSWVAEVIELTKRARQPSNHRGGVLDLAVVRRATKVPWNIPYQVLVIDECHLRSVNCDVMIALTRWLQSVGVPIALLLMSATANQDEFVQKLDIGPDMIINIMASGFKVDRYVLRRTPTEIFGGDMAMPNLAAAIQAIIQILLNDK
eukprot:3487307-Amphidinium_carterae.1